MGNTGSKKESINNRSGSNLSSTHRHQAGAPMSGSPSSESTVTGVGSSLFHHPNRDPAERLRRAFNEKHFLPHADVVLHVAVACRGCEFRIIVADASGDITIWDAVHLTIVRVIASPQKRCPKLLAGGLGCYFAVVYNADQHVHVFDAWAHNDDDDEDHQVLQHDSAVWSLSVLSPTMFVCTGEQSSEIVTRCDPHVYWWSLDPSTGVCHATQRTLRHEDDQFDSLAFAVALASTPSMTLVVVPLLSVDVHLQYQCMFAYSYDGEVAASLEDTELEFAITACVAEHQTLYIGTSIGSVRVWECQDPLQDQQAPKVELFGGQLHDGTPILSLTQLSAIAARGDNARRLLVGSAHGFSIIDVEDKVTLCRLAATSLPLLSVAAVPDITRGFLDIRDAVVTGQLVAVTRPDGLQMFCTLTPEVTTSGGAASGLHHSMSTTNLMSSPSSPHMSVDTTTTTTTTAVSAPNGTKNLRSSIFRSGSKRSSKPSQKVGHNADVAGNPNNSGAAVLSRSGVSNNISAASMQTASSSSSVQPLFRTALDASRPTISHTTVSSSTAQSKEERISGTVGDFMVVTSTRTGDAELDSYVCVYADDVAMRAQRVWEIAARASTSLASTTTIVQPITPPRSR
eukprot:PhM_4_TR382/c0_g1_i1/m.81344